MDEVAAQPLSDWAAGHSADGLYLNATGVALDGRGIAILGAPGRGKSGLALALMAFGARLVSDDGLWLRASGGGLRIHRPDRAPDLIEARGVGLLHGGPICQQTQLALVVDLDRADPDRLPPRRMVAMAGHHVPLIRAAGHPSLPPVVVHMLRYGRADC